MRNISLLSLVIIVVLAFLFLYSCNKEFDNTEANSLVFREPNSAVEVLKNLNFLKDPYAKYELITENDIINIQVIVKKIDGVPKLISEFVQERNLVFRGVQTSIFHVKTGEPVSKPGWNNGYIWDGDKCFVYCHYFENEDGLIFPWSCCGDTPGDCVGFDPVCAGEDEAWVIESKSVVRWIFNRIFKTV